MFLECAITCHRFILTVIRTFGIVDSWIKRLRQHSLLVTWLNKEVSFLICSLALGNSYVYCRTSCWCHFLANSTLARPRKYMPNYIYWIEEIKYFASYALPYLIFKDVINILHCSLIQCFPQHTFPFFATAHTHPAFRHWAPNRTRS